MSVDLALKNSQGKIFYGMHFYPGLAEYSTPGSDPFRVYLNEDTIRAMDPTFAGRPIFVEHVDGVESDLNKLKAEADGWVIESFFNKADGKHWVKFIIVSDKAERAIKSGMRLSNAYIMKESTGHGGLWNGIQYQEEITSAEYEHLAIVSNPRYEESIILTPEQFKEYNEKNNVELLRLSNSKDQKGDHKMKLNFFKRAKVENALDIEGMLVALPKTGKEVSLLSLINAADEMEDKKAKNEVMADMSHKVKMHDGSMCNVGELMEKHKALMDEIQGMKAPKNADEELETGMDEVGDRGGDTALNEEPMKVEEDKELEAAKKKNAREKADALKNANVTKLREAPVRVMLASDKVALGKSRYGSN